MNEDRATPAQLLAIAEAVVAPAAAQVAELRAGAAREVSTKSTETDVVTAADRAVERQLVAELRRRRPTDAVFGEEYGAGGDPAGAGGSGVRWLLDPIDGTVNYLYGIPWYAVSIAAEVDGEVVAGVVRNAATGDQWSASAGHGAWREGRRLRGSTETRLGHALVATGFGYQPARRAYQAEVLARLLPQVRDVRRLGAAALDLCLAAEGTVDVFYERGLQPWDHAAGGLIAAEAGLTVAGLDGAPGDGEMFIAAPPALFGPLHDRLRELAAAAGP
ncbi:inositol monophosphatase [Natronosporangium hydrolyticum]|uniref:Inositol-1-monophosphatase n=1 Tax=Natronosporangium hydrolyticum TaxID=2811111 RepID=A0A895YIK6_9ACTN|nr:inositol monophosphatase [Natronosporangium hydrolyticum]